MKRFKKQIGILILSIVFLTTGNFTIKAQGGYGQERIKAERIAFFTEQLELSTKEAEKFWPLYNDYSNRREMLNEENRMLIRFAANNMDNLEESEINEQLNKYVDIQNQSHKLFLDYNEKFLQILPAEKVLKLYITETKFKQYLMRKIGEARRDRQGNRRY